MARVQTKRVRKQIVFKISKSEARRLLTDVPEQYAFRCRDGEILRNMRELRDALLGMAEETFAYHSNSERSDFGNWVRDIVKDDKLERDLRKSLSRLQAARSVAERFSFLSNKLAQTRYGGTAYTGRPGG